MLQGGIVENNGSTARDYAMMERNLLSHMKLAVLLSLLASSVLLRARLVPQEDRNKETGGIPMAIIEFAAALLCIIAGGWEYWQNYHDLRNQRAFLTSPKCVAPALVKASELKKYQGSMIRLWPLSLPLSLGHA